MNAKQTLSVAALCLTMAACNTGKNGGQTMGCRAPTSTSMPAADG